MMRGFGRAHAAVSVLNAIPTGVGGAVGIELWVEASVRLRDTNGIKINSRTPWGQVPPDERLIKAIGYAARIIGHKGGVEVEINSSIPPASGLKSSSAVINAIILGILDAVGEEVDPYKTALIGVIAAKKAGLTITGAYDDSLATVASGVFITDNPGMRILRNLAVDDELYAVITVPGEQRPIYEVDVEAFMKLKPQYKVAVKHALAGDWISAMTINGILTIAATGWRGDHLGLVAKALTKPSVLAAGMSGKGPAVFAVTRDPDEVLEAWGEGEHLVARLTGGGS